MVKWISRFSFSFLILGVWLLLEAHNAQKAGAGMWHLAVLVVGASLSISLGIQGIRLRHRPRQE